MVQNDNGFPKFHFLISQFTRPQIHPNWSGPDPLPHDFSVKKVLRVFRKCFFMILNDSWHYRNLEASWGKGFMR